MHTYAKPAEGFAKVMRDVRLQTRPERLLATPAIVGPRCESIIPWHFP